MLRTLIIALSIALALPAQATEIFITGGVTWNVPADWNSADNTIECIGAGGNGATKNVTANGGTGGGGGEYRRINNQTLTASSTVDVVVGAGDGQRCERQVRCTGLRGRCRGVGARCTQRRCRIDAGQRQGGAVAGTVHGAPADQPQQQRLHHIDIKDVFGAPANAFHERHIGHFLTQVALHRGADAKAAEVTEGSCSWGTAQLIAEAIRARGNS